MQRIIVWFRKDLRISDNAALYEACLAADEIIPFYCFEQADYRDLASGFPKTGSFRTQFLIESVADLQAQLAEKQAHLQIYTGSTLRALEDLKSRFSCSSIYTAQEVSQEELELEDSLENAGFELHRFWQYSLYDLADLPFQISALPPVFTPFRKKMEKYSRIAEVIPRPEKIYCPPELKGTELPSLEHLGLTKTESSSRAVLNFKGGSTAAWSRLDEYFWEADALREYKETRNGLLGANYSSKFSPWLASGSISAREIYWEIKAYEAKRIANSSTYWLYFELMWRDYFRFCALKEGPNFFRISRKAKFPQLSAFEAWKNGQTGQDFVDANMLELKLTGFMSNRGRQNVASYLIHDLKLPWYLGAQWFESCLIDYDVCSNYGNWTYLAGSGNDPRENRYFNVAGQANRYDPDQSYRDYWLMEKP